MAREKFDLDAIKAGNFKINDRGHLAKAQNILLGYEPYDIDTIAVIRTRLQDAVGNVPRATEEATETTVSNVTAIGSAKTQPVSLRRLPNLYGNGNGKWEGRMRRVKFIPRDRKEGEQVITARWEELKQDVIADQITDMPWPLYMNFSQAEDREYEKVHTLEPSGKYKGRLITTEIERSTPKYNYIDLGDVPGTEDLPESFYDYFCKLAKQTRMFLNIARPLLLKVHGILYEVRPMTAFLGVTDQDIRVEIAVRLGPDYEEMMQAELYGEAVA